MRAELCLQEVIVIEDEEDDDVQLVSSREGKTEAQTATGTKRKRDDAMLLQSKGSK